MNLIDKLVAIKKMCDAYGAQFQFRHVDKPIFITIPYAGAQTGELVRCFADELLNHLGIYAEIEMGGRTLTFNLNAE